MRLAVHPAAQVELDDALAWCKESFGQQVALCLHSRFDKAGRTLTQEPGIGTPAGQQTRKLKLGRKPYSLVYQVRGDLITVLAMAHDSRKPGYWHGR